MKNKCIWPVALLAVAGAGLWHFLEVQEGAVAVGDAWMRGWYLALLTAVLVFLAGAGLAFSGKSPASFSWIFRMKSAIMSAPTSFPAKSWECLPMLRMAVCF